MDLLKKKRCRCYFETVHRSLPILDQNAFGPAETASAQSSDALALRWAMYAHVANSSPIFATSVRNWDGSLGLDYSSWFCSKAKQHIESVSSGEGPVVASMTTLQTMLLVAFYELRNARFSLAWTTISHATWLAQMLQLPALDSPHPLEHQTGLSFTTQYPAINSDSNEARRTLWGVLTLNSFMGVGVSWNIVGAIEYSEVCTWLGLLVILLLLTLPGR